MHLTLLGDLSEPYFHRSLEKVQKLLRVPQDVHVYVVDEHQDVLSILHHLPRKDRDYFRRMCAVEKVSFSYHYGKEFLVLIILTSFNRFLLRDAQALEGLLLHELMHLEHMRKGTYYPLHQSYRKVLRLYSNLLTRLQQKRFIPLLENIGQYAVLLLKDLYTNAALIQRGYGQHLLHYYEREFSMKKICPRPVFYDKLKRAVKKDPHILGIVLHFEFSLLSVILPFKKYKEQQAKKLLRYIARCYNLNMQEILRKCGPFITYYLDHYSKPRRDFAEKYFHLIFTKVVEILT